jgi:hypothetical protein
MSIDKELLLHSVRIKSDLLAPAREPRTFIKKVTENVNLFDSEEFTTAAANYPYV